MLSVLVVDDDAAVRENLVAYLEDEGMQMAGAESGEQAVQMVRDGGQYQVCVMDMRLPGMDGNATVMALHALRPELVFLVHTGSANYALPAELRAIGIVDQDVFMKPLLDMALLANAIRAVSEP
ncbi:MAG: response regulator [Gammaproteobacteria bacterium]|nr:response regulator [Gammaproteobacteria bacterium]